MIIQIKFEHQNRTRAEIRWGLKKREVTDKKDVQNVYPCFFVCLFVCFVFQLGFTHWKTEQLLRGINLEEKEAEKD